MEPKHRKPSPIVSKAKVVPPTKEVAQPILDMTIGFQSSRSMRVEKKPSVQPSKIDAKVHKHDLGLKQTPSALRSKGKDVVMQIPEIVVKQLKPKTSVPVSKSKHQISSNPLGFGFFVEPSDIDSKKKD